MKIQRRYRCLDCGKKWVKTSTVEDGRELVYPPCPECGNQPPPVPDRVAAPAIVGSRSRAVDEAWRIAQEDYGLTNMNDSGKEGDTAFIAPPAIPNPTPQNINRPQMLWGGASSSQTAPMPGAQATLSNARGAAMLAKAEGRSPMEMLHRQKPKLRAIPVNRGS